MVLLTVIMTSELKLDFVTLDVFTSTRFLGNPLAVVFVHSDQKHLLTQATKQRIAHEFNLSETVFLHTLPSEPNLSSSTREIDIFLTNAEIPFAGHPTIGTAYLILQHLGWTHITTLLTKAGPIPVSPVAAADGEGVSAAVPQAVHTHRHTLQSFINSPSTPSDVKNSTTAGLLPDPETRGAELSAPIVDIVKGMTFGLVRLPSLEHLARVKATGLELGKVPGLLDWDSFAARYYFVAVTTGDTAEDGVCEVRTRNVELGFEDPATGSAACALAGWLAVNSDHEQLPSGGQEERARFRIVQGVEMGRRSEIDIEVVTENEGGKKVVREVKLGGKAVVVMNGSIVV